MKQFFATARMRVKESSTFGLVNLLGGYLLRAAGTLAMLMIWRQLADGSGDLGGMTLEQTARRMDVPVDYVERLL